MRALQFLRIERDGALSPSIESLSTVAAEAVQQNVAMYERAGEWRAPWVAYVALEGSACVGCCAFTRAPRNDRVEIAYYTFPDFERGGVATAMAHHLIELARGAAPSLTIIAQTLAEPNASTRILEKLGFVHAGVVAHEEEGEVWEWHLRPSTAW